MQTCSITTVAAVTCMPGYRPPCIPAGPFARSAGAVRMAWPAFPRSATVPVPVPIIGAARPGRRHAIANRHPIQSKGARTAACVRSLPFPFPFPFCSTVPVVRNNRRGRWRWHDPRAGVRVQAQRAWDVQLTRANCVSTCSFFNFYHVPWFHEQ